MKITVFIATSLDGFIARGDGGLDWLDSQPQVGDEDYGYRAFIETVDVLVMGRKSYEKVLSFKEWPYEKPVVVLSDRLLEIPESIRARGVELMKGGPAEIVARLEGRGVKHVYLDGGVTIQGFLRAGLVQRMIITRIPVLIGSGISLFGELTKDLALRHVATRSYPSGFVQSEYEAGD